LRRTSYADVPILTIDQCQGQEADIVILSLVQKPTLFLNKNRLNVALSRVRRKLYLVADKSELEAATKNKGWDCRLLATDLLNDLRAEAPNFERTKTTLGNMGRFGDADDDGGGW
jgi:hypothetical protein